MLCFDVNPDRTAQSLGLKERAEVVRFQPLVMIPTVTKYPLAPVAPAYRWSRLALASHFVRLPTLGASAVTLPTCSTRPTCPTPKPILAAIPTAHPVPLYRPAPNPGWLGNLVTKFLLAQSADLFPHSTLPRECFGQFQAKATLQPDCFPTRPHGANILEPQPEHGHLLLKGNGSLSDGVLRHESDDALRAGVLEKAKEKTLV